MFRRTIIPTFIIIALFFFLGCDSTKKVQEVALTNYKDSLSYSIGKNMAKSVKQQNIDVNPEVLAAGITDVLTDKEHKMSDEAVQAMMQKWQQEMMQQKQPQQQGGNNQQGEAGRAEGQKFLAENKTKEGVTTTASGLQYKVVKEGSGAKPTAADKVTVHYTGKLLNGTKFDSSLDRGQPASFPLSGVIKGWTEGLQLMGVGAKYTFYIPSDMAYGSRGYGATIPPNATLIFDVELLGINQ